VRSRPAPLRANESIRAAAKCGLTPSVRHDAALIENGSRRYVMVVLTKNASWSLDVRSRFLNDLDSLIKDNNP
jgi:hypothetical protein